MVKKSDRAKMTRKAPPPTAATSWAIARDAVPEWCVQISIYDQGTGERVATVFSSKEDAAKVAAVPDLYAAVEHAAERAAERGDKHSLRIYNDALAKAKP